MDSTFTSLLIADDHPIILKGFRHLLLQYFSNYSFDNTSSIFEMEEALASKKYTHLILDLHLTDGTTLDVLPRIKAAYPELYVLIYSMVSEDIYARKLLSLNVSGFLSKSANESEIVHALRIFFSGGYYISDTLRAAELVGDDSQNHFKTLSTSELKVLSLLLKGYKGKEIAAQLNVKPQTITSYKSRIFTKLGTSNILDIQKMAGLYNINFS